MVNYVSVGTNKLEEALAFYDKLLPLAGMKQLMNSPRGRLYASADGRMFGVMRPFDGQPATAGNGSMFGFILGSRKEVDAFHKLALDMGGANEGDPGPRGNPDMHLYFAYVRDLDGNKLCAYCVGPDK